MAVCAGGPEALKQGARSQHLTSEEGEEMPSFPVEPGPRGREALAAWEGGSGVPRASCQVFGSSSHFFNLNAIC